MRRGHVLFGLIVFTAGACSDSAPATSPLLGVETPTTNSVPTAQGPVTSTTTTTTVPLPSLPDLDGELAWFAPLPPLSTGPGRPFIGSDDFMELFKPGAAWDAAASHIQVFKLYGEWVAYGATDVELAAAVKAIRERGMALAVEAGPLDADEGCGVGIEGFAGTDEGNLIANRIRQAGGSIDLVALDEPYYYASIYDGPNACGWSAEKVAEEVAHYVDLMRSHFPAVIIGDTEPTPPPVLTETYTSWLETFRAVNGYDLGFLHLDIDWARTDWPVMVDEIVAFGRSFGVPVGMIYIGNGSDPSDEVNVSVMGARALRLEDEFGVDPGHVLFQSWVDHPDRVLPESAAYTFTWLVRIYFEDRDQLGIRTEGAGANVAYGKVARAAATNPGDEPQNAFDGDTGTLWSAGESPPQWIEVDLGGVFDVAEIRLVPSQYPAGRTVHLISGSGPDTGGLVELGAIDGETNDGDYLVLAAGSPWLDLDTIRVETISSPSWVAWREIEVIAVP
jgi:hypothetical protein